MKELNLEKLRKQIDILDEELIKILAKRFEFTEKVGIYKKIHNFPSLDQKRENSMFKQREQLARKLNIDQQLIKKLFILIINKVKENHEKIKNE